MRQAFEAYKLNEARFKVGALKAAGPGADPRPVRIVPRSAHHCPGPGAGQRTAVARPVGPADRRRQAPRAERHADAGRVQTGLGCRRSPRRLSYRPELILARQDLKFRQFDLILQKNFLKPDLRFFANYDVNGIGTRLDGGPDFRLLTDPTTGNHDDDPGQRSCRAWRTTSSTLGTLGLRLDVPLGFRDATLRCAWPGSIWVAATISSRIRSARPKPCWRWRTANCRILCDDSGQPGQREANARQLELRFQEYRVGRGTLDVLLEAQRNFADSLATEYNADRELQQSPGRLPIREGYDHVVRQRAIGRWPASRRRSDSRGRASTPTVDGFGSAGTVVIAANARRPDRS